jgi:hypothetical protein
LKEFGMTGCISAMKEISLEKLHQAGSKQYPISPIRSVVHNARDARITKFLTFDV